jgi:hypothetical protein
MYSKRSRKVEISNSGVWRIVRCLDHNRQPGSQRYKRQDLHWKRTRSNFPGMGSRSM